MTKQKKKVNAGDVVWKVTLIDPNYGNTMKQLYENEMQVVTNDTLLKMIAAGTILEATRIGVVTQ